MKCFSDLKIFEKWEVFFKTMQLILAALTLFIGYSTYESNKKKDRKAFILQYCTSTNTIPVNIKVAAQELKQNRSKDAFINYRNSINEFLSRIEVENSEMKSIAKEVLSFVPALTSKRPEFEEMLKKNNLSEETFIPGLIEELKQVQKKAIDSCVKMKTESL